MKKTISLAIALAAILLIFSACKKEKETVNPDLIIAQNNMAVAYNKALSFNDSITYHHHTDSSMSSAICHKFDSLYHQQDMMFGQNYVTCNQMAGTNGMMGNHGMIGGTGSMYYQNSKMDDKYNAMITNMNILNQNHHHFDQ